MKSKLLVLLFAGMTFLGVNAYAHHSFRRHIPGGSENDPRR